MGYRSDISFVVKRSAFADMWRQDADAMIKVTDYACTILKKDDAVLVLWSSVKWYDSYDEIGKFERLVSNLDSDDYHFLRLGESNDDAEELGGYWDNPFDTGIERSLRYSDDGEVLNLDVFR
jgi:hypothetical protein